MGLQQLELKPSGGLQAVQHEDNSSDRSRQRKSGTSAAEGLRQVSEH